MPDLKEDFEPANGLDAPANILETVTPSDTVDLDNLTRGLYIGVSGDVTVVDNYGRTFLFKNAVQGTVLPIRICRVNATATTATNMIGLS